jgi:serine protease
MKSKIILTAMLIIFLNACQHSDEDLIPASNEQEQILKQKQNPVSEPTGKPLSRKEIDDAIERTMKSGKSFSWTEVDLKMLWSAFQYDDQIVAIGYRTSSVVDIDQIIDKVNVRTDEWKAVHDAILDFILTELNRNAAQPVKLTDILIEDDAVLPILTLKLSDRKIITSLYNLINVRYLEPLGYWPVSGAFKIQSTSGCSASTQSLNSADYTTIPPGCMLPWNYNNVNIPAAWTTSQGAGIKIGVIDAGISSSQSLLGGLFQNGYSNVSRTISLDYTYGSSAYSTCTHGTSMSGLAVGPRNDQNAITGVAYQSSLFFVNGCEDVVLDKSSEKTGVKNALIKLGNDADTRIISMSVGNPFASSVLRDGVVYAYNKGKMLFAAAGTSFSWTSWWGVVYPAAYSQCIAITGVKENGSTCSSCHDGSQVKFTVPMERSTNSNRNSLSLSTSNFIPTYIGGSSAATATAAGIAALVWSAKTTLTRDQVYMCLKNTSQFYPSLNSTKGYGNLNAGAAVALAVTL